MKLFLGVDSGATGGIAALDEEGEVYSLQSLKDLSLERIYEYLSNLAGNECTAVIERVTGYIPRPAEGVGEGVAHKWGGQPGSAMFEFGKSFGSLLMALTVLMPDFEQIGAKDWQKAIGAPARVKGQPKHHHKRELKEHAEGLFPRAKVTLAVCDALLLSYYCLAKAKGAL